MLRGLLVHPAHGLDAGVQNVRARIVDPGPWSASYRFLAPLAGFLAIFFTALTGRSVLPLVRALAF